ncbi:HAMP domain-containing histidine kinase [Amycolatopsis acidicola]|uniref:histidine kinase n=1 Tax=Amycolatopsis acidicola TaxID=2596893 RepID=A0A5N0V370_9PSEU|nr:HAMP domain-containing sensor histidine kinase [Amycolatopsis acidicola]KAA9158071.1 HAMP domain-containing histidine kinase [Amycolatopsis acidicola]
MNRWRAFGLRTRLLLAFALVSVVTATGVAGLGYVRARDAIVQRAQDNAVIELTNAVEQLYPLSAGPETAADLERIAGRVSGRDEAARAESSGISGGGMESWVPSPELRATVAQGRVAWQRVDLSGTTVLVIGTQLWLTTSGEAHPSGITVFVGRTLTDESNAIGELARDAWLTGGAGFLLALILALLAAYSVLRPVRELRAAARRLGEGDLDARLEVRGGDELAAVAQTFNTTAESLQRHVGELRRMEADSRRFVADVSHELRTPLAAMTAVTDMLDAEAGEFPEVAGEAVRLVSRETHNLARLVDDLIEVTRFDAGTAALAVDDVDLAEAIRATLRLRGFSDVTGDLPAGVHARVDPRRLDVIVANLVGNALRHGAPPVAVRLAEEGGGILVEVTDHGPGLPDPVLPHVFSRFYKADTARGRSEGSGLGLAIAWENARLHGGTLTAGNRPEGGAVFTLWLPRDPEGGAAWVNGS